MAAASSTDPASPFSATKDGVWAAIRLTPKAARRGIGGLAPDAVGGVALKVSVTEPADKGRANAALIALLAHEWDISKSSLSIVQGATNRRKTVAISGDPARVLARLAAWLDDTVTKNG